MVDRKLKSLVMRQFVERSCVGVIHIPSHHLTFVVALYRFCTVCFGHKIDHGLLDLEKMNTCKLLRIKR